MILNNLKDFNSKKIGTIGENATFIPNTSLSFKSKSGISQSQITKSIPGRLSSSNALLTATKDYKIQFLYEKGDTIQLNSTINFHKSELTGLDWSKEDERYFLSVDKDRQICMWDLNYTLNTPVLTGKSVEIINNVRFIPGKRSMMVGTDENGGFSLWDVRNSESI